MRSCSRGATRSRSKEKIRHRSREEARNINREKPDLKRTSQDCGRKLEKVVLPEYTSWESGTKANKNYREEIRKRNHEKPDLKTISQSRVSEYDRRDTRMQSVRIWREQKCRT